MKRLLLALSCSIAWNCHIPGLLAAPASSAGNAANAPRSAALQTLFRKAVEAYEAKKWGDATELFTQILSKQSDHTASRIYLARAYYQQKNANESLKAFRQVDPKLLEPEAAYEYGQVAFRSNEYTLAVKAFATVPNGHPLYDLAGFYGGISSFKLGEYQQAIDLFDQAVVLPTKLVRLQKLYRKQAEKNLIIKQKQELQASSVGMKGGDRSSAATNASSHFYLMPNRGIGLSYKYMNQTLEPKNSPSEEATIASSQLALEWASDRPATSAHNQWLFLLSLKGSANQKGSEEFPALQTADQLLEAMVLLDTEAKTLFRPELALGYETMIGDKASFGFQAGGYAYAPDSDVAKRLYANPYVSIFVTQSGDTVETRFKAEEHLRFKSNELLLTQSIQEGTISFNFSRYTYFSLTGELNEYSYNVDRLSGPDWNGHILLQLGYKQERSLSLVLGTFYEVAQGWRLYDFYETQPLVKFNINQSGALFKADFYLASWLTLGASARIINNTYSSAIPAGAQDLVDVSLPSTITQLSVFTAISKSF